MVPVISTHFLTLAQQIVAAPRPTHHRGAATRTALDALNPVAVIHATVQQGKILGCQFTGVTGIVQITIDKILYLRRFKLKFFQLDFGKRPFKMTHPFDYFSIFCRVKCFKRQLVTFSHVGITVAQGLIGVGVIH